MLQEAAHEMVLDSLSIARRSLTGSLALPMPRSVRLARLLSDRLSPPIVALGVFWVLAGATARATRWPVFLACATTQSAFPLAFLGMAVRQGKIRDVNMSKREERRIGFLALGLVYALGGLTAVLLGVRGPSLLDRKSTRLN